MLKDRRFWSPTPVVVLLVLVVVCWASTEKNQRPGWQKQQVNWRMYGGAQIREIYYPKDKPPPTRATRSVDGSCLQQRLIVPARTKTDTAVLEQSSVGPVLAYVIDSPPLDGFLPLVTVSVTDAHTEDLQNPYNSDACDVNYVEGNYLTANPESDYAIGIFDTGASASLISHLDANLTGMDPNYITSSEVILLGASGSQAQGWASQALGIFVGGLDMLDVNELLLDDTDLAGEYNVSLIVGDSIESPYVPTAIGAPFAIFFSTVFCNNKQLPVEVDGNDVNTPRIRVYAHDDSRIPYYPNKIYLELRPSSVGYVQYFPCVYIPGILECPDGDGSPLQPTIIVDGMWEEQALFFVSSVDLTNDGNSSIDKDGFMYDTGAQVTVVSEAIGARLSLDPHDPCFIVPIIDVTGEVTDVNGYYIDSLEIVSSPTWLSFTNVPVIMLDVESPEGGILDGIIGMNLFNELNFVFRGGGLSGMGAPYIRYEPVCRVTGDIAPFCGDCSVDNLDLGELCSHWLQTPSAPDWNPDTDLAPNPTPDGKINFLDFAMLAAHWLEEVIP